MTSFQLDYLVKDSYLWIAILSIMAPIEIVDDFNILSITIFHRVKNTVLLKIQNEHIKNVLIHKWRNQYDNKADSKGT